MSTTNPNLPPVPSQSPLTDTRGILSQVWYNWFNQLFQRVGQYTAPSNTEIGASQSAITTLQNQVATLQGQVATINTQISTINSTIATINSEIAVLQGGLSAGRQL